MAPFSPVTGGEPGGPGERGAAKRPSLSRWHRLMYLLVAFAVLSVALSLYLSHQFMRIYVRSVAGNQTWVERLDECSRLGQLAASVNAPGNDVFQSHQVDLERGKMEAALRLFNNALEVFEQELRADADRVEAAPVLEGLHGVRHAVGEMSAEARRLFAHLGQGRARQAGESMAAMDRHYARANRCLERLRAEIAAIQKQHFDNQTAAATALQRFEYAAAALILLLTVAALAYGHKVRRQVESATREKENSIEALRESEAQLDRRVRERTAELVRANEALSKEVDERLRAEEALRESEGRYRQFVENTHDMIQSVTPEGRFLFVNRAWVETLGYPEADLLGLNLFDLVPPAERPPVRSLFAQLLAGKPLDHFEATLVARGGRAVDVEGNAAGRHADGRLVATHWFFRDITERKQVARVRRQLLQKVMSAQEEERARIARDLHDGIGQALTSLLIGLRTVAEAPTLEAARARAEELRHIGVATLEEVRLLARGLRPSVLDDLGLIAALERYAEDFTRAHGVAVEMHAGEPAPTRLPREVETALYRIVQEALTNTAKHAAARHVRVAIEPRPTSVQVVVEDDGRGFDSSKRDAGGHLGLSGMRERAALLGGAVTIASRPGDGTTVRARIPLTSPPAAGDERGNGREGHGEDSRAAGG